MSFYKLQQKKIFETLWGGKLFNQCCWNEANACISSHRNCATYDIVPVRHADRAGAGRRKFFRAACVVAAALPKLGDLYVSYDVPCSLTLTANTVNVQYPGFAAEIPIPRDIDDMRRTLLTPRSQVSALYFLEDQPCDEPIAVPSSRNIYVRWCGFTTLGAYIERCRLPGLILLPS